MASKAQLALRQARALEQINDRLGRIEEHLGVAPEPESAEVASAPEAVDEVPEPGTDVTQGAVNLAAELGVDLSEVSGSGAEGKIIKSDVANFAS